MITSFTIYQCDPIGHFLSYNVPTHVTQQLWFSYAHGSDMTKVFHDSITDNFYKIKSYKIKGE